MASTPQADSPTAAENPSPATQGPFHWLDIVRADLRFALRTLSRSPGYALTVVVTLGLAIGANSAIFSLVDGVLLRPLPYEHGERLVVLEPDLPRRDVSNLRFSVQEVYELRERTQTLEEVVEHHSMSFILLGRDEPSRVSTGVVSSNFFDVLGVEPTAGRLFVAADEHEGAEAVLVLSWEYWQRAFGGDRGVVGQVFEMNDKPHTVVGILPAIPQWPATHDVYMPTIACPFRARGEQMRHENRSAFRNLTVFARLPEDGSAARASSEVDGIAAQWLEDHPETYLPEQGLAIYTSRLDERLGRGARSTLAMLVAISALVLLIACANVANLGVARLLGRRRELAVRSALGAGRGRLLRQLLTESSLLALAGGALGLVLAYRGLPILARFVARYSPRAVDVALDLRVVAFTFAIALLAGLAAGTLPLFALTGGRPADALRDGAHGAESRGRARLRGLLVSAQVAASVVLLAAAGLFLRSLVALQGTEPGYETERIVTAEIPLNWSALQGADAVRSHLRRIEDAVLGVPGVVSTGLGNLIPLSEQQPMLHGLLLEGQFADDLGNAPPAEMRVASSAYFETLGLPILRGRAFSLADDAESQPVAVINQTLVDRLLGDQEPLGRMLSMNGGSTWLQVVGVAADDRQHGLDVAPEPTVYMPMQQVGFADSLFLRSAREPADLMRDVKRAIWAVAPDQVVADVRTLAELRRESTAAPRTVTVLVSLFAALALLITVAGVGSVVAHAVGQRRREIGVRRALGARRRQVLALVLGQGMTLVAAGLVLGLVAAWLGGPSLEPFLYATEAFDPLLLLAVAAILVATAVAACLLPARTALRVEPNIALRAD